jgi:parallel beta-helix repeat protein
MDSGQCSLLAAVMESNAFPGLDTIVFNIGGGGAIATIAPDPLLPPITDPVVIDGLTQGCAGPGPCVELIGELADESVGLNILAGSSTVRGLAIGLFYSGILLDDGDGNQLESNYVGLDATGTVARGNHFGIITSWAGFPYSRNNVIVGNRVAANVTGIRLAESDGTQVLSNVIGSDEVVAPEFFNTIGVRVYTGPAVIGAPGAGNVISGNGTGVEILGSTSTGHIVQSNCIGPIMGCTTPFGNTYRGVLINSAPGNTIGGTDPLEGNVIGGSQFGIRITGDFATGNSILGNYVGTDATGTLMLGNSGVGIVDHSTMGGHFIGGPEPGAGNLVMHNRYGIGINSGGFNIVSGNHVASNTEHGIVVVAGRGNRLRRNLVSDSGELGIDLGDDGVTSNDPGDADGGPNDLQNFPGLSSATSDGAMTFVSGWLDSTPNTLFELEFYANTTCDPSGHGEGESLLGESTVTTEASGGVFFELSLAQGAEPGDFITATATNPDGSTSEFSACISLGDEIPAGACCLNSGGCALSTEADCDGIYQGDGTMCAPGLCDPDVPASSNRGLVLLALVLGTLGVLFRRWNRRFGTHFNS